MQVIIKEKSVYGRILLYPACKKSELIVKLTGKKTFERKHLKILKELSYEVKLITIS